MDIERLKELREEVFEDYKAYMVKNLKDEDGKVYPSTVPLDECSPIGKDLLELIDEAIARQSVKSEEVAEAIEWLEHWKMVKECDARSYPHRTEHAEIAANCRVLLDALRWVPVIERVPDERDAKGNRIDVLLYADGEQYVGHRWRDGWRVDGEWIENVTHWRHLPPKPEEG